MARTAAELQPDEVIAVEELTDVSNERIIYKDNTWAITGLTVGTNLSVAGGALNATGGAWSDEKVKYDAGDPTAGYVADKIIAGTGISVAEGAGANENKLVVTSTITQATRDSLGLDTDDSPQFAGIELGAASDTTLARVGAGVISVEWVRVITSAGTTSWTILKNNGTTFVASTETYAAPGTSGNVLTSDGTNWTSSAPTGGGGWFWTLMPGTPTRVGNTSFTVTWDVTAYVAKGMIIKWTEAAAVRYGMVSIPSTYSAPDTTITIIGSTMASIDASSLKYAMIGAEAFIANFAIAGAIWATTTGWDASWAANAYYAKEPMVVFGADLQVGTAGTTNSTTIDINKGGTTMFTTKPTLATTVATSPTPFTADTATTLALADKVTIDIDAIQTTAAVDLYVQLYLFPTRYANL